MYVTSFTLETTETKSILTIFTRSLSSPRPPVGITVILVLTANLAPSIRSTPGLVVGPGQATGLCLRDILLSHVMTILSRLHSAPGFVEKLNGEFSDGGGHWTVDMTSRSSTSGFHHFHPRQFSFLFLAGIAGS